MNYQNPQQQPDLLSGFQRPLPNATAVLVLGILSIVLCFICGIVALILASGDYKLYRAQPQMYTQGSFELLRAGRICSIIGLCIWGVVLLIYAIMIIFFIGATALNQ